MRTYNEIKTGDVYVEATITFKGSVNSKLYDLTIAEWIDDILHSGDYEYDVVQGNVEIENVENNIEEIE